MLWAVYMLLVYMLYTYQKVARIKSGRCPEDNLILQLGLQNVVLGAIPFYSTLDELKKLVSFSAFSKAFAVWSITAITAFSA